MKVTDRLHSAHERRVAPFLRFFDGSVKIFGSMDVGDDGGSGQESRMKKRGGRDGSMGFPKELKEFPRVKDIYHKVQFPFLANSAVY